VRSPHRPPEGDDEGVLATIRARQGGPGLRFPHFWGKGQAAACDHAHRRREEGLELARDGGGGGVGGWGQVRELQMALEAERLKLEVERRAAETAAAQAAAAHKKALQHQHALHLQDFERRVNTAIAAQAHKVRVCVRASVPASTTSRGARSRLTPRLGQDQG